MDTLSLMENNEMDTAMASEMENKMLIIEPPAVPLVRRFKKSFAITSVALLVFVGFKTWKGQGADAVEGKMRDVIATAVDKSYSAEAEAEVAKDMLSKWKQDAPFGYVSYENINIGVCEGAEPADAALYKPSCGTPKGGWPGIVIVSGKGGDHERYNSWIQMLAGRGIVALDFDMCPANAEAKFQFPKFNTAIAFLKKEPYVNADDVTLLGYSAGGRAVNQYIMLPDVLNIKNVISLAGIGGTAMDYFTAGSDDVLTDPKFPNYLALQSKDDTSMGFKNPEKFVSTLKDKGINSKGAYWYTGNHQPCMETDFYYLISGWIKDPEGWEPPRQYTSSGDNAYPDYSVRSMHYGDDVTPFKDVDPPKDGSKVLSCFQNEDEKNPLLHALNADMWGGSTGISACEGLCDQIAQCEYYEVLSPSVDEALTGEEVNCVLFRKRCEKPKYKVSTSSTMKETSAPYEGESTKNVCDPASPEYPGPSSSTSSSTCQACLDDGSDYCISTDKCVKRATFSCKDDKDMVTGDEEWAEKGHSTTCP